MRTHHAKARHSVAHARMLMRELKAKRELNWRPKLNFDETIKLTIDWYKNYLDDKNRQDYYTVFHEKLEMESTWEKPVLALVLRGIEANKKIETILGHFNPEMARRTN